MKLIKKIFLTFIGCFAMAIPLAISNTNNDMFDAHATVGELNEKGEEFSEIIDENVIPKSNINVNTFIGLTQKRVIPNTENYHVIHYYHIYGKEADCFIVGPKADVGPGGSPIIATKVLKIGNYEGVYIKSLEIKFKEFNDGLNLSLISNTTNSRYVIKQADLVSNVFSLDATTILDGKAGTIDIDNPTKNSMKIDYIKVNYIKDPDFEFTEFREYTIKPGQAIGEYYDHDGRFLTRYVCERYNINKETNAIEIQPIPESYISLYLMNNWKITKLQFNYANENDTGLILNVHGKRYDEAIVVDKSQTFDFTTMYPDFSITKFEVKNTTDHNIGVSSIVYSLKRGAEGWVQISEDTFHTPAFGSLNLYRGKVYNCPDPTKIEMVADESCKNDIRVDLLETTEPHMYQNFSKIKFSVNYLSSRKFTPKVALKYKGQICEVNDLAPVDIEPIKFDVANINWIGSYGQATYIPVKVTRKRTDYPCFLRAVVDEGQDLVDNPVGTYRQDNDVYLGINGKKGILKYHVEAKINDAVAKSKQYQIIISRTPVYWTPEQLLQNKNADPSERFLLHGIVVPTLDPNNYMIKNLDDNKIYQIPVDPGRARYYDYKEVVMISSKVDNKIIARSVKEPYPYGDQQMPDMKVFDIKDIKNQTLVEGHAYIIKNINALSGVTKDFYLNDKSIGGGSENLANIVTMPGYPSNKYPYDNLKNIIDMGYTANLLCVYHNSDKGIPLFATTNIFDSVSNAFVKFIETIDIENNPENDGSCVTKFDICKKAYESMSENERTTIQEFKQTTPTLLRYNTWARILGRKPYEPDQQATNNINANLQNSVAIIICVTAGLSCLAFIPFLVKRKRKSH